MNDFKFYNLYFMIIAVYEYSQCINKESWLAYIYSIRSGFMQH